MFLLEGCLGFRLLQSGLRHGQHKYPSSLSRQYIRALSLSSLHVSHFFVFRMLASFVLIRSAFLAFIIFGLEFRLVAT